MNTSCWGVVVAAGRGTRFGGRRPKALLELAGTPLVVHAVRALREGGCAGVVVAAPAELVGPVAALFGVAPLAPSAADDDEADVFGHGGPQAAIRVVAGGATRQESVRAAIEAVPEEAQWVLIHDAARPLVPVAVVTAVRRALADGAPAVIPVISLPDSLKAVNDQGLVTGAPDRRGMRRAQTPQGFERDVLLEALDDVIRSGREVTDDAAAVAVHGVPVLTVPGDERGLKITTPTDLLVAEALFASPAPEKADVQLRN